MKRAHTTKFLFQSADFFVAMTDSGDVRIGMVAGVCFDVPAGHAYFDRIAEASTESEVEGYFDELVSVHC